MKPAIASLALAIVLSGPAVVRRSFLGFALPGQHPPAEGMNRPGDGPGGMHPRGWWDDPDLMEKLHVTDEQSRNIEKIVRDHQTQEIDLRADMEKQNVAMRSLIDADSPDEAQVLAQIAKIGQARTRLDQSHAQMMLAVRRVLTPEQAQILHKLGHKLAPPAPGFGSPNGGPGGPSQGGPGGPPDGPQGPPSNGDAN